MTEKERMEARIAELERCVDALMQVANGETTHVRAPRRLIEGVA